MTLQPFNKYDEGVLKALRISMEPDTRTPETMPKREPSLPFYNVQLGPVNEVEVTFDYETKKLVCMVNGHFIYGMWDGNTATHPMLLTNEGFVDVRKLHSGLVLRAIPRLAVREAAPPPAPKVDRCATHTFTFEQQAKVEAARRDRAVLVLIITASIVFWILAVVGFARFFFG